MNRWRGEFKKYRNADVKLLNSEGDLCGLVKSVYNLSLIHIFAGNSALYFLYLMFDPKFTISNSILKNIGTIEAAREVIADAPLLPLWEKKFRDCLLYTSRCV